MGKNRFGKMKELTEKKREDVKVNNKENKIIDYSDNSKLFRKQLLMITICVVLVVVIALTGSYAIFSKTSYGNEYNVVYVGDLNFSYVDLSDDGNILSLASSYPLDDASALDTSPYRFSVENTGTLIADYTVKIVQDDAAITADGCEDNLLDLNYLRYKFDNNAEANLSSIVSSSNSKEFIVYEGTLQAFESNIHEIRIWLNETSPNSVLGKHFHGKVVIDIEQNNTTDPYERPYEDASGANKPILASGMIPVTYDTQKGWVTVDTTTEWYNYGSQMWANAVTVSTEEARNTYKNATPGTPVSMDDINTMWVWIPRYEYQYTDLGTSYAGGTAELPGEIKVNFISSSQTTPSDANVYKIPEGFTFGEENLPGFWMAKFETSTLETCVVTDGDVDTGCDLTSFTLQVKPNVTSWRGARVSTMFEASRLMQSSTNAPKYGFTTVGNGTMDVHMLKNTEWGIVAMLSQSRYGKYGNSSYIGANKEVYQNKSSSYITGSSNGTPSTSTTTDPQITYDTPDTGYGASTTGTIYGVYDMSGGANEYVMGNFNSVSGNSTTINSGFSGTNGPTTGAREWPVSQYYDLYASNTASSSYKAGDATYEMSGWYSDLANFVSSNYPWFIRGGNQSGNSSTGVFGMNNNSGRSYTSNASRLAIKP